MADHSVLLLLDTSSSMNGSSIDAVNKALEATFQYFTDQATSGGTLVDRYQIGLISFGWSAAIGFTDPQDLRTYDDPTFFLPVMNAISKNRAMKGLPTDFEVADLLHGIRPISEIMRGGFPSLIAHGNTPLAGGLEYAASLLDEHNNTLLEAGTLDKQGTPFVIILTDGAPNGVDMPYLDGLGKRLRSVQINGKQPVVIVMFITDESMPMSAHYYAIMNQIASPLNYDLKAQLSKVAPNVLAEMVQGKPPSIAGEWFVVPIYTKRGGITEKIASVFQLAGALDPHPPEPRQNHKASSATPTQSNAPLPRYRIVKATHRHGTQRLKISVPTLSITLANLRSMQGNLTDGSNVPLVSRHYRTDFDESVIKIPPVATPADYQELCDTWKLPKQWRQDASKYANQFASMFSPVARPVPKRNQTDGDFDPQDMAGLIRALEFGGDFPERLYTQNALDKVARPHVSIIGSAGKEVWRDTKYIPKLLGTILSVAWACEIVGRVKVTASLIGDIPDLRKPDKAGLLNVEIPVYSWDKRQAIRNLAVLASRDIYTVAWERFWTKMLVNHSYAWMRRKGKFKNVPSRNVNEYEAILKKIRNDVPTWYNAPFPVRRMPEYGNAELFQVELGTGGFGVSLVQALHNPKPDIVIAFGDFMDLPYADVGVGNLTEMNMDDLVHEVGTVIVSALKGQRKRQ